MIINNVWEIIFEFDLVEVQQVRRNIDNGVANEPNLRTRLDMQILIIMVICIYAGT